MQISPGMKLAGLAALGIGAAALLTACAGGKAKQDGPFAEFTTEAMAKLGGGGQLKLATQSIREVRGDDGAVRGAYDGTRLLQAADSHAYGVPTIVDAQRDVQGDGIATFNEVRHVVQHFDVNASLVLDHDEARAFRDAVGIRWLPA